MLKFLVLALLFVAAPRFVDSHGCVMQPINRASRWRVNATAPPNYNDIELFCGGQFVQHQTHNGKCGLCGDNYGHATPRAHELGGKYGEGVIVERYASGSVVPVNILIKANHLGFFIFEICNIDKWGAESEQCFEANRLKLANGEDKHYIEKHTGDHDLLVKLSDDIKCSHCVFRWSWTAGNTWGQCGNGTSAPGCGPQETYKTCSDINIF